MEGYRQATRIQARVYDCTGDRPPPGLWWAWPQQRWDGAVDDGIHTFQAHNRRHVTAKAADGQIECRLDVCYHRAMLRMLIATHNPGKQREYRELLGSLPVDLCVPSDLGLLLDVAEDGSTYMENAVTKATTFQQASGFVTIADDSGLEVDALDGMPGVRSRRYGGPSDDDVTRYERLLRALAETPWPERRARFICAIALATSTGELRRATGVCEGRITLAPRGNNGFGYDPVFLVAEQGLTMAELPPRLKNRVSHRARAVQALVPILMDLAEGHSQRLDRPWAR